MYSTRNAQRTYPIELDGPYMGGQVDQDQGMLKPVFYENSKNTNTFITNKKHPLEILCCASMVAINYLNMAHNKCVEQDNGCSKGLKIFAIEIGLFAATFLLAPIEIITRLALSIILAIPITISYFACDEDNRDAFNIMSGLSFAGALVTPLMLAHGAISLYTNIAYTNRKIDYKGAIYKIYH